MAEQMTATGVLGGLPPAPRKALNNSVIAAEQAYRKRKSLPALTPEEIYCLKQGTPMPWEPGGTMPDPEAVAADVGSAPAPAAAAASTPASSPATAAPAASASLPMSLRAARPSPM